VNVADSRALTLVPGRSQISTLENRDFVLGTNTAVFDGTAGPDGSKGAVTFDRVSSQYIDGGAHTFNLATNGFTAVLVVMFMGTPVTNERVVDFGNGQRDNNTLIVRSGTTTAFKISIWNADSACYPNSILGTLVQDTWLTVVVTYNPNDMTMRLQIGDNAATSEVCTARTNRDVAKTLVGMSNWPGEPYFQGSIAGLYAVDELLSEAEIAKITSRMYSGEDTIQACETCPVNTLSLQGSTSVEECTLNCPVGQFRSESMVSTEKSCQMCRSNAVSLEGSTSVDACECQAGSYEETRFC